MIMERNYQPVIIFAFSKRECEALGQQMARLDFNTGTGHGRAPAQRTRRTPS